MEAITTIKTLFLEGATSMTSYQKRKQELKNLQDKYIKLSRKIENLIRLEMIGGDETLINNLREKIIEELGLENSINNSLLVRGMK